MTVDENPALLSQLDAIEDFGRRLTLGFRARCREEVEVGAATLVMTTAARLAREAPRGVLLARTRWALENGARDGCILWIGGWEMLVGGAPKSVGEHSADEIALLDQTIRFILEEEGPGSIPLNWGPFERVAGDDLGRRLEDFRIDAEFEAVQIKIGAGEEEFRFLFLAGGPASRKATSVNSPPAIAEARISNPRSNRDQQDGGELANLGHLLDVKIPLRIRLGSTRMSLEELLRIAPGAIVELDRREDEPLELLANGRVIARGEVVVVDDRLGLKITEIGPSVSPADTAG